jgi:hypothetical protein
MGLASTRNNESLNMASSLKGGVFEAYFFPVLGGTKLASTKAAVDEGRVVVSALFVVVFLGVG